MRSRLVSSLCARFMRGAAYIPVATILSQFLASFFLPSIGGRHAEEFEWGSRLRAVEITRSDIHNLEGSLKEKKRFKGFAIFSSFPSFSLSLSLSSRTSLPFCISLPFRFSSPLPLLIPSFNRSLESLLFSPLLAKNRMELDERLSLSIVPVRSFHS